MFSVSNNSLSFGNWPVYGTKEKNTMPHSAFLPVIYMLSTDFSLKLLDIHTLWSPIKSLSIGSKPISRREREKKIMIWHTGTSIMFQSIRYLFRNVHMVFCVFSKNWIEIFYYPNYINFYVIFCLCLEDTATQPNIEVDWQEQDRDRHTDTQTDKKI